MKMQKNFFNRKLLVQSAAYGSRLLRNSLVLLIVTACAPTQDKREFKDTKPTFVAKTNDTKLTLPSSVKLKIESEELLAKQLLRFSTDLYEFAPNSIDKNTSEKLKASALLAGSSFFEAEGSTIPVSVVNSPFLSAAAGAAAKEGTQSIDRALKMLNQQEERLLSFLKAKALKIPDGIDSLAMLNKLTNFLGELDIFLDSSETDPMVRIKLKTEINNQAGQKIESLQSGLIDLENAKTIGKVLDSVDRLIAITKLKLDSKSRQNYKFGRRLDHLLNKANSSQNLMEVAVLLWEYYTPKERDLLLKPFSEDLYQFLEGQDQGSLDCIAGRKECDLLTYGEKFIAALSIESEGIETITRKAIQAGQLAAKNIVRKNLRYALLAIPSELIEKELKKEFAEIKSQLNAALANFKVEVVDEMFRNWIRKELSGLSKTKGNFAEISLTGLEAERIELMFSDSGSQGLKLAVLPIKSKELTLDSEQFAASLLASVNMIESKPSDLLEADQAIRLQQLRVANLKVINQLFLASGYRDQHQKLRPSLIQNLSAADPKAELVDITKFTESSNLNAIPDRILLAPARANSNAGNILGFEIQDAGNDTILSVHHQAHLLKALTRTLFHYRDWESSSFDLTMGKFQVASYLPDLFKSDKLSSKLFPKSDLFALAVANAALILNNFNSIHSPLFVVTAKGENHFDRKVLAQASDQQGSKIVMAAAVDLKLSSLERNQQVESEGLSEMILSLADFYQATEGIERTQSNSLKPAIESLLKARQDVVSLVHGMGIFLSQKLRSPVSGGVLERYSLEASKSAGKDDQSPTESLRTKDQILAMRALLKVSIITGQKGFTNFAIDILHSMNKHIYSKELGFYAESSQNLAKAIHWTELPSALSGLKEISQQVQGESKTQLEALIALWENQLLQISW